MGYLFDTNILSELRKGNQANPNLMQWVRRIEKERQTVSVLSLGEIQKGIAVLERKDPTQAKILDHWLSDMEKAYAADILPVCNRVAHEWGRLNAQRTLPVIDGLLAATARVHGLQLVTRNVGDFQNLDLVVINPFERNPLL